MKRLLQGLVLTALLTGCQQPVEEEPLANPPAEEREEAAEDNSTNERDYAEDEGEQEAEEQEESSAPTASYQINQANWTVEPVTDEEEQVVLLTIDDAPDQHSLEMAETLKELEKQAIFFVNGHFLADESGKEKLKTIYEMGFEIGNHTMNHANLSERSDEEQRREIVELNELIEEVTGERPRFFRAPFGVNTETSAAVVEEEEMIAMNWTYGYDWEADYQDAEALAEIMVDTPYLTNGANLLMHDRQWTLEALPAIINGLEKEGFEFVDPAVIQ
ncbi:polysaccharide deacetylase family protein [Alkalihalobacillus oceani]|uniref:polysaccharide deacetylase family protein n=1 Tax=Halalkalibacter oceani TaxID=1653776 RepID=UPI002041A1C4|nr:polysaccharide deacetylase family protein [Halalkalibacter oceani]MCM3759289.1 polysaccharide deacetylase family protein [Halalkalibacter oceani]